MRKDRLVSEVLGEESVLSPSELYNKEFHRVVFGGYNNREVDTFLERVADALEPLIRQVRDLKAQVEQYKSSIEEYRQMEETLRNALVTSQKFGENLIESARREADTLIASARSERELREAEASRVPVALAQEIAQLQEQRNRLRADINSILAAHKALIEGTPSAEERLSQPVFFGFKNETAAAPTAALTPVPPAPNPAEQTIELNRDAISQPYSGGSSAPGGSTTEYDPANSSATGDGDIS